MELLSTGATIVLIGSLRPDDFTIRRFAACGALSEREAFEAEYENLLKGQIVDFRIGWGKFVCLQDRLLTEVWSSPYVRALDLTLKAIRELSSGNVISQLGINVKYQARLTPSERDNLAMRIAPAKAWGDWGKAIQESLNLPFDDPRRGGLITIQMRSGVTPDKESGWLDATLLPADGDIVTVTTNDHHQLRAYPSPKDDSAKLISQLEANFDRSIARSLHLIENLLKGG